MKTKILFSLFIMLTFAAVTFAQQVQQVTSTEAAKMLASKKKFVVLDVRTPGEFNSGHIKGAINIDINDRDAEQKIKKLDRNANYIVHCRTKNRSQAAVEIMQANGFKNIYKMHDGFAGWSQNNLPVEK